MASNEIYKLILLGESNVGKTSIVSVFIKGVFLPDVKSTDGASYMSKKITLPDNNTINLDIWDISGQKKYRALTKFFFKDAKGVILVYDPTREESFEELKEYWYQEIKDLNLALAVVANKSDLDEKEVKDEDGKKFAESIGAIFASVSAKDNIGITSLFERIAQNIGLKGEWI